MTPIMNEYPRKKYKKRMLQGLVFILAGMGLALLIPSGHNISPADQTIALFRFLTIMGAASVFYGGYWLLRGFVGWMQN